MRPLVIERATELCEGPTAEQAVPLRAPRWAWIPAALAVCAVGMLGVRYGVHNSLDLRPPIAESAIRFLRPLWFGSPDPEPPGVKTPNSSPQTELASYVQPERPGEDRRPPEPTPQEHASLFEDEEIAPQEYAEDPSLFDQLKDALKELMDRLGMDKEELTEKAEEGEGSSSGEEGEEGEGEGETIVKQGELPEGQGEEQASTGENMQPRQGEENEGEETEDSGGDESTIAGDAEGTRDVKEAEREAAMGQLSELFGQRQAELQGDVLVESYSDEQQRLRTDYAETKATHSAGGGQVSRDEVPLAYQQYVEKYFEQVHRPGPDSEPEER
jgi:hypothetical protein